MKIPASLLSRQRGAAAVELALILPIMVVMLMMPIFLSRFLWHYTVAQKAAQDAARYLSTISEQEMREDTLTIWAGEVATDIALAELAELSPGTMPPQIFVTCGGLPCRGVRSLPLPDTVGVTIRMYLVDPTGWFDNGRYGVPIDVTYEMSYVGS